MQAFQVIFPVVIAFARVIGLAHALRKVHVDRVAPAVENELARIGSGRRAPENRLGNPGPNLPHLLGPPRSPNPLAIVNHSSF